MPGYTKKTLRDVENSAPKFDMPSEMQARFARTPLEGETLGLSLFTLEPNFRIPFGHKHNQQEEVYVVISGSLRAKMEDEVLEMKPWDAIRVHKDCMRGFEAGPEGAEVIAFGAPNTGPGDGDIQQGWWSD